MDLAVSASNGRVNNVTAMLANSAVSLLILSMTVHFSLQEILTTGGLFEAGGKLSITWSIALSNRSSDSAAIDFLTSSYTSGRVESAEWSACALLDERPLLVIVEQSDDTALARSIFERAGVPQLLVPGENANHDEPLQPPSASVLPLAPPTRSCGKAAAALVDYYKWAQVVVLYQTHQDLMALQDALQLSSRNVQVSLHQIPKSDDLRPFLKFLKGPWKPRNFILRASLPVVLDFFESAHQLQMTTNQYSFIVAHTDFHLTNLQNSLPNWSCNITGMRLLSKSLSTSDALLFDAVRLVELALMSSAVVLIPTEAHCDHLIAWSSRQEMLTRLHKVRFTGESGSVSFDSDGGRQDFAISIYQRSPAASVDIGSWSEASEFTPDLNFLRLLGLPKSVLLVTVYVEEPFIRYKLQAHNLTGNARYEGYCIDLLEAIAADVGFSYVLHEVADRAYGIEVAPGRWNGLVGEIQRGEADVALAALTISSGRSKVVDFTVPFYNLGISILFRQPKEELADFFTFLRPLSFGVWIYLLLGYVTVSLTMWMVAKFSPTEWYSSAPYGLDVDPFAYTHFTILNSLWFSVGSLMQQGNDLAPRALSTRIIAVIWWFFTLILISSYTAKLAAFLTVARMTTPIENAQHLADQDRVQYGILGRGSTMEFFQESQVPMYARMWQYMESTQPSTLVDSNSEGVARVKAGRYAFLAESSILEYYVKNDCQLMQTGGLLDSKGYGIGLPKGSPYRERMSQAILRLQENTVLENLKDKWWQKGAVCAETGVEDASLSGGSAFEHVAGIFVLLACSLGVAAAIASCEFAYKMRADPSMAELSIGSAIWREFKSALRCAEQVGRRPGPTVGQPHSITAMLRDVNLLANIARMQAERERPDVDDADRLSTDSSAADDE